MKEFWSKLHWTRLFTIDLGHEDLFVSGDHGVNIIGGIYGWLGHFGVYYPSSVQTKKSNYDSSVCKTSIIGD